MFRRGLIKLTVVLVSTLGVLSAVVAGGVYVLAVLESPARFLWGAAILQGLVYGLTGAVLGGIFGGLRGAMVLLLIGFAIGVIQIAFF